MHSQLKPTISAACIAVSIVALAAQNPDGTRLRTAAAGPPEPPHQRAAEVGWRPLTSRMRRSTAIG